MPSPFDLSHVRALAFALSTLAIASASAPALALPRPSPRPHEPAPVRTLATLEGSTIALYELRGSHASAIGGFTIDGSVVAGIAIDRGGRVIAALVQTQTPGPCTERGPIPTSCLAVYDPTGKLLAAVAPPGGDADATYTGVAADAFGNLYVSDRAFNAIFSYATPHVEGQSTPTFVAQADPLTSLPSSVAIAPRGGHVAGVTVPTRCDGSSQVVIYDRRRTGFSEHDLTCRASHGAFAGRSGPIAVSDDGIVLVPLGNHVDAYARGRTPFSFALPSVDARASGLAMVDDRLYVADGAANVVYVYAPVNGGWMAGAPTLVGLYRGFSNLGPIAVR
ncbi:MAG: hypothetical protein ABI346_01120 [Candidatus Baltobacteraceae bacterium]